MKILVIVGPTASGKSDLAVKLAKKFNGEIISADSRQVYKNLDIGTGKITKKEMSGIAHHLLDVANPKKQFSAAQYKTLAQNSLQKIIKKNKLPIVTGGTGFYIDTITGRINFPNVSPNKKLRKKLSQKSTAELFQILKKKDPKKAKIIDPYNKVRLIRALEIIEILGQVPALHPTKPKDVEFIYIGLKPDNLDEKIYQRLCKRLRGIIREVKKLREQKLSWKRLYGFGLEYRHVTLYLQKKFTQKEMVKKLYIATRHYAKRQMTWFKRNKKIKWFTLNGVEGFKPTEFKKITEYVRMALSGD